MSADRFPFLSAAWPFLLVLALMTAAFAVVCSLPAEAWAHSSAGQSVADRLLGSTRVVLGDAFYERGDDYFHRGVPHEKERAFTDVFQKWAAHMHPAEHAHATGTNIYEVMPWLDFTIQMNPHHVEAYLVASFWLARDGGRPDLAMKIVADGIRANPGNYQLYAERGRLLLLQGRDDLAAFALENSVRLWPSGYDPEDVEVRFDLARNFSYLSVIRQAKGDMDEAVRCARRAADLLPQNAPLRKRVGDLENGVVTAADARQTMEAIFPVQTESDESVCGRSGDPAHDHEHEAH